MKEEIIKMLEEIESEDILEYLYIFIRGKVVGYISTENKEESKNDKRR